MYDGAKSAAEGSAKKFKLSSRSPSGLRALFIVDCKLRAK
jgi:hypothetical protein